MRIFDKRLKMMLEVVPVNQFIPVAIKGIKVALMLGNGAMLRFI